MAAVIDMLSDTVTKPTQEMRVAMMNAEVGDDVYNEDPTVCILQKRIASMLGKEAALFFPSGTMANITALMVHASKRGDEIIIGDRSHICIWEQGGVAQLGGIFPRQVRNLENGTLDLDELETKLQTGGRDGHFCNTKLVCVENTHNFSGGRVLSLEYMEKLHAITNKNGLLIHVDGARLFNAATALNVEPAVLVQYADSVSTCLSKAIGAPIGSVLSGSQAFIDEAHRIRKVLGGGMRQVGVLAAAAIVGLDTVLPHFERDHRNAKLLAQLLSKCPRLVIDLEQVQTNMVLFSISSSYKLSGNELIKRLENPSDPTTTPVVRISEMDKTRLRAVLHHQVSEEDVKIAAKRISEALETE